MAIQRHNAEGKENPKKSRKGISVGPGNLPDGTHLRKVRKIQHNLIRKAKLKKSYQKLKERENFTKPEGIPAIYQTPEESPELPASLELHPDRQAMLSEPEVKQLQVAGTTTNDNDGVRRRQPRERRRKKRKAPFEQEARLAEQRRAEEMAKRKEFEENRQKREQKLQERERFRKAMAKARVGGKNGQRKLGRESAVLLEKAKCIMEQ